MNIHKGNSLVAVIIILGLIGLGAYYLYLQTDTSQNTERFTDSMKDTEDVLVDPISQENENIPESDFVTEPNEDVSGQTKTATIYVAQQTADGIEMIPFEIPYTQSVLRETLKKLFEIESNDYGYNGLEFDSVSLTDGVVTINLAGNWRPAGDLSGPYMRQLINQSAFQFDTVEIVEVFIDNERFNWCIDDLSDGEGGCPQNPHYWIDAK